MGNLVIRYQGCQVTEGDEGGSLPVKLFLRGQRIPAGLWLEAIWLTA